MPIEELTTGFFLDVKLEDLVVRTEALGLRTDVAVVFEADREEDDEKERVEAVRLEEVLEGTDAPEDLRGAGCGVLEPKEFDFRLEFDAIGFLYLSKYHLHYLRYIVCSGVTVINNKVSVNIRHLCTADRKSF